MEACRTWNDAVNFNETCTKLKYNQINQALALTRGHQLESQQETADSEQAVSRKVHFQRNYLQRWE